MAVNPVPATDAVRTLAVLDAARLSAERGSSVAVSTSALNPRSLVWRSATDGHA